MTEFDKHPLEQIAFNAREHVIRMTANGGCFAGAALSCVDLLTYLYGQCLNVSPETTADPERDYFFLSKGHAVPALYAVLAEVGFLEKARLKNHLLPNDSIYWHPNRDIPAVEFHSGSLGHGLPVATGVALDCKLRDQSNRIIVMTGDGELNEGSNWEALLAAQAYRLDNLIVIIDRNEFQANLSTEALIPIEPLEDKFRAFGCATARVNGHNLDVLHAVFSNLPLVAGKPSVIIADTVRGRGVPSIEARADRWFCNLTQAESDELLAELRQQAAEAVTA